MTTNRHAQAQAMADEVIAYAVRGEVTLADQGVRTLDELIGRRVNGLWAGGEAYVAWTRARRASGARRSMATLGRELRWARRLGYGREVERLEREILSMAPLGGNGLTVDERARFVNDAEVQS